MPTSKTVQPMSSCELSIVIPVYNSAAVIGKTVAEIDEVVGRFCTSFEIVLVDDGSTDDTAATIHHLAAVSERVRSISLARNFGQHNATMAGLHACEGRMVAIMDDDGQHDPAYLEPMMHEMSKGFDVVFAQYHRVVQPLYKNLGSRLTNLVARWLIDKPAGLYLSAFKLLSARITREIIEYHGPYPYIDGLILSATRHISSVPVEHRRSAKRSTSYSAGKLMAHWLDMFTNFSVKPLRLVFFCALFCGVLSLVVIGITITLKLTIVDWAPPGWTTNFLLILLFGTIQFLCLGLLGEYVGRILLALNNRPQFSIREESPKDR